MSECSLFAPAAVVGPSSSPVGTSSSLKEMVRRLFLAPMLLFVPLASFSPHFHFEIVCVYVVLQRDGESTKYHIIVYVPS